MRATILGVMALVAGARPVRAEPCCGPITPDGTRLAAFLDASGVRDHWLAGWRIIWQTGAIDPEHPHGKDAATHCSAFVAAMALRLGIYVLRPPDHEQHLLASAQMGWLADHGAERGWRPLGSYVDAQEAANRGELVLEAYANPKPKKPGHIAIVRPSQKSRARLDAEGPQETQAGAQNSRSTATKTGFSQHPGAWLPNGCGALHYYAHDVAWR